MTHLEVALLGLLALSLVSVVVLVFVAGHFMRESLFLAADLQEVTDAAHAKCMGAVMQYVGDEWAAQVLEVAASDWENVETLHDLDRISRLRYQPGGVSVPALWMEERAAALRAPYEQAEVG